MAGPPERIWLQWYGDADVEYMRLDLTRYDNIRSEALREALGISMRNREASHIAGELKQMLEDEGQETMDPRSEFWYSHPDYQLYRWGKISEAEYARRVRDMEDE